MTKPDNRKRIPIPKDIQPGDELVLRDGQRREWMLWNIVGDSVCAGYNPGWHSAEGKSLPGCLSSWDVVAIERKAKPKPTCDDKDAVWLMELMEEGAAKLTAHSIKRIRAIARRLNGGKAVDRA